MPNNHEIDIEGDVQKHKLCFTADNNNNFAARYKIFEIFWKFERE